MDPEEEIQEEALKTVAIAILEALPEDTLVELKLHLEHDSPDALQSFLRTHVPHFDHVVEKSLISLREHLRALSI
jgi:hypothetical protein